LSGRRSMFTLREIADREVVEEQVPIVVDGVEIAVRLVAPDLGRVAEVGRILDQVRKDGGMSGVVLARRYAVESVRACAVEDEEQPALTADEWNRVFLHAGESSKALSDRAIAMALAAFGVGEASDEIDPTQTQS